jgi:hypothetical protein
MQEVFSLESIRAKLLLEQAVKACRVVRCWGSLDNRLTDGGYVQVEYSRTIPSPPLRSSGQSSWLQIQRSGFDSRRYQIFWQVVGLERGPLSLVSTIEELLGRKRSGSGLENREYGRRDPLGWPRDALYPQKLALTSPTSGGRSVGIVRSRTEATEFSLL